TVVDLFAPSGLRIVSAQLASDGSTDPTIGWNDDGGGSVAQLAIERADASSGPFTEIARVDPSLLTFADPAMPSPRAYYRLVAIGADDARDDATTTLHVLAVHADAYAIPDQTI